MLDISKIKLVIWDLDETLWSGTITEENVRVSDDTLKFLTDTSDMGIVHSICSKNEFEHIKSKMTDMGLWDRFVFPSVDWSPKGARIKTIIEKMALRPVNVLFIDDNIQNLKEAEFFCPGIMTALPSDAAALYPIADAAEKKDKAHKRLAQYRILEAKDAVRGDFNSNTDFLMSCGIKVEMISDCEGELDRIHELLMRSNQLNYTKFRQPKEELALLLKDKSVRSGIVRVSDIYGDYGLVGFYAIKDGKAIHFLFSCRTLGMLVEQYVYKTLGCPKIDIVGDVVTELNDRDLPEWINNSSEQAPAAQKSSVSNKILFKGPCDLLQMFAFIKKSDNIVTEFAYTNDAGIFVEGHNHTASIASALSYSSEQRSAALAEFSWLDDKMLTTSLENEDYDFIFLSLLADGNLGLYKNKESGIEISLCEAFYPLTEEKNFSGYTNGTIYGSNIKFTNDELLRFSDKYEFIDNSDFSETLKNLDTIYRHISPAARLVLITGSETACTKDLRPAYKDRHLMHKAANAKIAAWAEGKDNVSVLCLGKYINSESDYIDSVNHFTKEVYYKLAQDIVSIINQGEFDLHVKGPASVTVQKAIAFVKKMLGR